MYVVDSTVTCKGYVQELSVDTMLSYILVIYMACYDGCLGTFRCSFTCIE